jgi:small-conductance mechanosensitive channel
MKESQLKVLQLEHDLKLKEMKLEISEMRNSTQIDQYKNQIMQLEISVSKLANEKLELLTQKDIQIRKIKLEVKQLEQELIDAKMQSANLKSRLQEQQNKVVKLKKNHESKFLQNCDIVKVKEESIIDPMAKFHNT